jgi:hypothetical protein
VSGEDFRGGVHFVVGGVAAALTLYNLMRFIETKERRNLVNACAYGSLFVLEVTNTRQHWTKPDAA